jgi:DnaJ family protein A protein 2
MDTTDTDEPKDHHAALGVDRNATRKALRAAYYKHAKKFHPDKGGDPVVFERLAAAWEVLDDSAKRGCYDRGEQEPPSDRVVLQDLMSKLFPVRHWGELS